MNTLNFNLESEGKKFKLLNATNGGPWHKRHANDQFRSNFEDYKKARIPYSRNHDSSFDEIYGGSHSHDIANIFRDFNADPHDPASYDFACTDESIMVSLDAGTKTFFRLGQAIEHYIKKYGTIPPADFKKWAVICEHIIRHYTEGWADGYELDMDYWEIWNEPDLAEDDCLDKKTWGGTQAQFFDFYEIAAKHLKECFPHLKIGGPALAWRVEWGDEFLEEMQKRNVPLDFFSWHGYSVDPEHFMERAVYIKNALIKYGYGEAESIFNEWNYVKDWEENFVYSIKCIHGLKGSSFILATMALSQQNPIDMLMYYDTRPSCFNAAFDFYTYEPLKGYYPFYWYGMFYDMVKEIPSEEKIDNIYSICGVDENGKVLAALTYYDDNDSAENKKVTLNFGKNSKYEIYLLDETHDGELVATTDKLEFDMAIHSSILIKEI